MRPAPSGPFDSWVAWYTVLRTRGLGERMRKIAVATAALIAMSLPADWSVGVIIYVMGVLTGAALTGWSPAFFERWQEERSEREQQRKAAEIRNLVHREAEKYTRARDGK